MNTNSKLTDYLAKVQSPDDRDRLAEKYRRVTEEYFLQRPMDETYSAENLAAIEQRGYFRGHDSRTADITRLCEIVKLLHQGISFVEAAEKMRTLTQADTVDAIQLMREYRKLIDQLIEGSGG